LGVKQIVLHWKLSDLEKRSVRQIYQAIGEQMGLAGLGRVRLDEWLSDESDDGWPATLGGGWHQLGTTRMHVSEKKGVVDPQCKIHGIDNLLAGAGFLSGGAVNPRLPRRPFAATLRSPEENIRRNIRASTVFNPLSNTTW
jgi:choline dehydrogenase-like flavoprotein